MEGDNGSRDGLMRLKVIAGNFLQKEEGTSYAHFPLKSTSSPQDVTTESGSARCRARVRHMLKAEGRYRHG